jgi:uncharacterized protein (DUF2235 family)
MSESTSLGPGVSKLLSCDLIYLTGLVRDTVSSVGMFRRKSLPMTDKFNNDICYFRHALALDELRVKFQPEYVCGGESYIPPDRWNETNTRDHSTVKEVWFQGCHSDVCIHPFILPISPTIILDPVLQWRG